MPDTCLEIIQEIAKRKPKLVVFAGTGVSEPAGIPNWKELVEHLCNHLKNQGHNVDISGCENNIPHAAQRIYDVFVEVSGCEEKGRRAYIDTITQYLEPQIWPDSACQHDIIDVCKDIVTTNFDRTFENAFKKYFRRAGQNTVSLIQAFPELNFHEFFSDSVGYRLAYLHGKESQFLIFKEDDYENYYRSTNRTLVDFYEDLWRNKTLLFIGFSFNDRYVVELFQKISRDLDKRFNENFKITGVPDNSLKNIKHYAFLIKPTHKENTEDKKFKDLCKELERMNIRVLVYEKHADYCSWLEMINCPPQRPTDAWSPNNG
jgi:hypothetical protein